MILPVEVPQEEDEDYARAIEDVISTLVPPLYNRFEHLYCLIKSTATIYSWGNKRICDVCYELSNPPRTTTIHGNRRHCICNYMGLLRGSICTKCGIGMVFRRPALTCSECTACCLQLDQSDKDQLLRGEIIVVEYV